VKKYFIAHNNENLKNGIEKNVKKGYSIEEYINENHQIV